MCRTCGPLLEQSWKLSTAQSLLMTAYLVALQPLSRRPYQIIQHYISHLKCRAYGQTDGSGYFLSVHRHSLPHAASTELPRSSQHHFPLCTRPLGSEQHDSSSRSRSSDVCMLRPASGAQSAELHQLLQPVFADVPRKGLCVYRGEFGSRNRPQPSTDWSQQLLDEQSVTMWSWFPYPCCYHRH